MSRRRKALVATAFTYTQLLVTAITGLFLTRYLIRLLGQNVYGTWLATAALLGYAALADLGILGVMPWLFAEADGAKDAARMRSLLVHGLASAVVGGAIYLVVAACVWKVLPGLLHLSSPATETLRGPVIAMSCVTAIGYPTRLFAALRLGLQDYSFMGSLGIAQTLLNLFLVVGLSPMMGGLYAVALGASVPPIVIGTLSLARTMSRNQDLLHDWPALHWSSLRPIMSSGAGQWLGSLGWQLAFASDAVVIGYLGHRDLIPMFDVTSRLGLTLMRLSWVFPDSASVGLAQLRAESASERSGHVVATLLRFHLLTAGLVACGILAANFGFVTTWVGHDLFGGAVLNGWFALDVLVLSVVHGLLVPVAVFGRRVTVGTLTLLNGGLHIGFALVLGRLWGLAGVAAATSVSAMVTTMPSGVKMLTEMTSLTMRTVLHRVGGPWLLRMMPCCGLAIAAGWAFTDAGFEARVGRNGAVVASLLVGAVVGVIYLVVMRPVMRELPFGPRLQSALAALHLV